MNDGVISYCRQSGTKQQEVHRNLIRNINETNQELLMFLLKFGYFSFLTKIYYPGCRGITTVDEKGSCT